MFLHPDAKNEVVKSRREKRRALYCRGRAFVALGTIPVLFSAALDDPERISRLEHGWTMFYGLMFGLAGYTWYEFMWARARMTQSSFHRKNARAFTRTYRALYGDTKATSVGFGWTMFTIIATIGIVTLMAT